MNYMEKPCQHCPFREDVTPFLHPSRAEEISAVAENPYSSFQCHKTIDKEYKECAGMLTLRAQLGESVPEGFEPAWREIYADSFEMVQAYQEEWAAQHAKCQGETNE